MTTKKLRSLLILTSAILLTKLLINSLLVAENGDTYDFFKIAYFLKNFDWTVQSKRMPFLPLLIAYFPINWYVWVGRMWINLFYFASIFIFYKNIKLIVKQRGEKAEKLKINTSRLTRNDLAIYGATLVFASNIIVFENSFYILADTIFLFWNLLYMYTYQKFGVSKWFYLTLISGLAFYTRPEGLILFVITGTLLGISKTTLYLYKIKYSKHLIRQILYFGIISTLIISPYLIRNYLLYGEISHSGYFTDRAGFIFNTKTVLMRLSSFVFGVGGTWLIPIMYLIIANLKLKIGNTKKIIGKYKVETLMLIFYSIILFLWGPYIRLYSVPTSIIIMIIFLNLEKIIKIKPTRHIPALFTTIILFIISSIFYIFVVQRFDQGDLGYKKYGKIANLIFSTATILVVLGSIGGYKKLISKKNSLLIFTLSIIIGNLLIFGTKFYYTRYKYGTIKKAVQLYMVQGRKLGNLAYSDESGLEKWYLKDFNLEYKYQNQENFLRWSDKNKIKYVISTDELGYKDALKFSPKKIRKYNLKLVQEFKSPFFYGSTRLWEVD